MGRPTAAVMIIIDGLSDISSNTALSTAHIPNLDAAAARGCVGLIDPVRPGLACGSDTAHLAIFGYDPETCYRGRGAFEAMGAGVEILPGDIAFKCNFGFLDETTGIVTTRCAEHGEGMHTLGKLLAKRLDGISVPGFEDVQVHVRHTGHHRCVVRLRGGPLSDCVTNTDPLINNRPLLRSRSTVPGNPAAIRTACILNQVSDTMCEALNNFSDNCITGVKRNPVTNVLLLRGASRRIQIKPFHVLHGIQAFLIAPCKIIAGVGITAGIDMVKAPGATGGYDTDLLSKARACVEYLMLRSQDDEAQQEYEYSLGIVHIKAVDEAVCIPAVLVISRERHKSFCWEQVIVLSSKLYLTCFTLSCTLFRTCGRVTNKMPRRRHSGLKRLT